MKEEKKTYRVKTKCSNCKDIDMQEIEKGKSTSVLEMRDCPRCGCYHCLNVINY